MAERTAEIQAFKNTDFADCPEMAKEDWRRGRAATRC
jgi:hypothetical protein